MKFRQAGGGADVLTFTDTFARIDQPFGLGDLWGLMPTLDGGTTLIGPNVAGSINVTGNQANFSICSSNGSNDLVCFPIPISWGTVFTRSQFAQCAISADNSGGAVFAFNGPCVFFNANKNSGYWIKTNNTGVGNQTGVYIINTHNGSGAEGILNSNGNAGFPFSLGDILRIEGIIVSPTNTTIKTYRNGVLQSTSVDTTAHYQTGFCGFFDAFISAGVTQSIQNFKCGAL